MAALRPLSKRLSSTLVVPYTHLAVADFKQGVPTEQVRDLLPTEKKWNFWTSSKAFFSHPDVGLFEWVPPGETWVMERFGKFSKTAQGFTLVLPFDKIKAVKSKFTVSMGVLMRSIPTANGPVDAYCVAYIKITDPVLSAYYVDPKTKLCDSEKSAGFLIEQVLKEEVSKLTQFTEQDAKNMIEKMKAKFAGSQNSMGVEFVDAEIRGIFPEDLNVADKLRALDAPAPLPDAPGHNLKNDYWADVLTPSMFEKCQYGSAKESITPAAVSLEWCIPSPPDYHHFNMVPKMVAAQETK
jgi:hypothetical protein